MLMARTALLVSVILAAALLRCTSICNASRARTPTRKDEEGACVRSAWAAYRQHRHNLGRHSWRKALRLLLRPRADAAHDKAVMASTGVLDAIAACDHHSNLTCSMDATLPHVPTQRTFIAAALKEVGALMPHYILELLMALAQMPVDQTFVSIYESGSTDTTVQWLLLLDEVLDSMGTRHRIVTGGAIREEGQDRIDFLVQTRNAVIEPMLQSAGTGAPEWPAERLLFINDVFFCARHIIRLLQHNTVSAACGMDFLKDVNAPKGRFYDTWVMRDAGGAQVDMYPPYLKHAYSRQRLEQGLPFPVSCCWNGMVSLDARPFTLGLRFRLHREGECMECEASNLCTDFFHLGYQEFIVDPGVHLGYESAVTAQEGAPELHIMGTTFADIQRADPIDWDFVSRAFYRTCCNKKHGLDWVDQLHCDETTVKDKDHTAAVFRRYLHANKHTPI